jgi:hypothetical protein
MGPSKKAPARSGTREEATRGSKGPTRDAGCMVDAPVAGPATEPTPGTPHPTEPSDDAWQDARCVVFGKPVSELRALIDGQSAAIITKDGSFVFSRVYWDGQFDLGDGKGRSVAGQRVARAVLDSLGLWVHFTDGDGPSYQALVPLAHLKASWRV